MKSLFSETKTQNLKLIVSIAILFDKFNVRFVKKKQRGRHLPKKLNDLISDLSLNNIEFFF